jgi:hypothetical protein
VALDVHGLVDERDAHAAVAVGGPAFEDVRAAVDEVLAVSQGAQVAEVEYERAVAAQARASHQRPSISGA